MFAVLAGDDKLADTQASRAMLQTIPQQLLELHWHPQNYHENFNELNRDTIFRDIEVWLEKRLASGA